MLATVRARAELACETVMGRICRLGLEVAEAKTEALVFGDDGQGLVILKVGDRDITSASAVRYLGVMVDRRGNLMFTWSGSLRRCMQSWGRCGD